MKSRSLLFSVIVMMTSVTASAQTLISFTFHGTSDQTAFGYTEGQAVEFTFVIANSAPPITPLSSGGTVQNVTWADFGEASERLFDRISGTGITGTWGAPNLSEGESAVRNSYASVDLTPGDEQFALVTNTQDFSETPINRGGLQANGIDMGKIMVYGSGSNPFGFTSLPEEGTPLEFLFGSGLNLDTYALDFTGEIFDLTNSASVQFSISSVDVALASASAVPEPSSFAAILGGMALVGTALRRRPRIQA